MSSLSATKKRKKSKAKPSRFQKLMDKADRLQRQNTQLRSRLDGLVKSAEQKIRPAEKAAAEADLPLLKKLLTLGQRKSLAKWERGVLDEWIRALIDDMQTFGISDSNLMDDIARYDAFRMGVELDESSDGEAATPYEQMSSYIQNLQAEAEAAAEQERKDTEAEFNEHQKKIDELVEKILDERLGPPPSVPQKQSHTIDFLQNELDEELLKQSKEYQAKRDAFREELIAELNEDMANDFDASTFDDDPFDDPDFDFESFYQQTSADPTPPKIDNQTFHKMFRATAARLHPDREPDPSKRLEKQQLMVELLRARKNGDLLTVFRMYQQHTDNREAFTKADEKQLLDALSYHIEQLEQEAEAIIHQSPMHYTTYHRFYHASKKKQDREIEKHIQEVHKNISASKKMSDTIKSLKTLKPVLEVRYDQVHQFADMDGLIEDFMEEFLDDVNLRDCPF